MTGSSSARSARSGAKAYPEATSEATPSQWHTHTDRGLFDPPPGYRVEPSIADQGFPASTSAAYEKLHGLGPDFGEYRPPSHSRLRRLAMMAGVFIVGASVGLAAAWWLQRPPPGGALAVVPASQVQGTSTTEGVRPARIRGISPSELPYDGAPPPAYSKPPAAPAVAASTSAVTTSITSGTSETDMTNEGNSGVVPEQDTDSVKVEESKSLASGKRSSASTTSVAPKRKSVTRTDREIERIRQQADEELKKKTENGRALGDTLRGNRQGARNDNGNRAKVAARGQASRVSATRAMLARCDRSANFIRREFCRWQVCNGSWGRNGCPSYQQQTSSY